MIKNIYLFAILILLVIGTFYFQERRVENDRLEAEKNDSLILGEITQLKLPSVAAVKKNGQWWDGDDLLSHNIFNQIEKKLKEIKKMKVVSGSWDHYFSKAFKIEVNNEAWAFGELSLDKQSFYVSRGKSIYLAQINGESKELTTNPDDIASTKLKELLGYLSKDRKELLETQLFRFYPNLPLEKAILNLDGHLPFELNLATNATLPPPIQGVSVHPDLKKKFQTLLTQVTIKEKVPFQENLGERKLGQIVFSDKSQSIHWELWLKNSNSADAILVDPKLRKAYLMYGGTLKIFFISIQEYWDKKVIPEKDFIAFERLPATFSQNSKFANIVVLNKEPLDFETTSKFKIDKQKMEELIQIILNLGPREQSDRVSLLSNSERKQFLLGDHLRLNVMNQELILWRKTSELIVANMTQGFKAHFFMANENFRGTFQDVLK
jgi:hypothetical protein